MGAFVDYQAYERVKTAEVAHIDPVDYIYWLKISAKVPLCP